jgi:hypothetical protein
MRLKMLIAPPYPAWLDPKRMSAHKVVASHRHSSGRGFEGAHAGKSNEERKSAACKEARIGSEHDGAAEVGRSK